MIGQWTGLVAGNAGKMVELDTIVQRYIVQSLVAQVICILDPFNIALGLSSSSRSTNHHLHFVFPRQLAVRALQNRQQTLVSLHQGLCDTKDQSTEYILVSILNPHSASKY